MKVIQYQRFLFLLVPLDFVAGGILLAESGTGGFEPSSFSGADLL